MDTMIYDELKNAQRGCPLSEYLAARRLAPPNQLSSLNGASRLRIIDSLLRAIEGVYCHLPQKRSAYATDPPQALRLLRERAVGLSDGEFHLALVGIVTGLRDAHTLYSGPKSDDGEVAALPFLVEQFGPHENPTFIASKIADPSPHRDFEKGVELISWNGIPFARAVDLYADWETGGRPDARRARALESLTFRALEYVPPPDELRVDVEFMSKRGEIRSVNIPWRVVKPGSAVVAEAVGTRASRHAAVNPAAERVRRAKKLMFSGELWRSERESSQLTPRRAGWIPTTMQDVLAARTISPEIGYLRIWSFDVENDDQFIDEVCRLLSLLPQTGLILDVRGNPGGLIWAAERALQLFTPNRIVPTRFSLLATDVTREMATSPFNRMELEAWLPSLEAAISTGDLYSQPLPLTDPEWCNDRGQVYSGPVVCVVDPNTYSAGDLFAAGFVDNQIGPLVSVGEASGGGGANVWTHHALREALEGTQYPLAALPRSVGYSLAVRRAVRSVAADGVPIEDLGVPGIQYAMTSGDLLAGNGNQDLVNFCVQLFEGVDRTAMDVVVAADYVAVTTSGLDELETYVDGRPFERVRTIADGDRIVHSPRPAGAIVELVGRRRGQICQRRRVELQSSR
jgi:Peptidase family S41